MKKLLIAAILVPIIFFGSCADDHNGPSQLKISQFIGDGSKVWREQNTDIYYRFSNTNLKLYNNTIEEAEGSWSLIQDKTGISVGLQSNSYRDDFELRNVRFKKKDEFARINFRGELWQLVDGDYKLVKQELVFVESSTNEPGSP